MERASRARAALVKPRTAASTLYKGTTRAPTLSGPLVSGDSARPRERDSCRLSRRNPLQGQPPHLLKALDVGRRVAAMRSSGVPARPNAVTPVPGSQCRRRHPQAPGQRGHRERRRRGMRVAQVLFHEQRFSANQCHPAHLETPEENDSQLSQMKDLTNL